MTVAVEVVEAYRAEDVENGTNGVRGQGNLRADEYRRLGVGVRWGPDAVVVATTRRVVGLERKAPLLRLKEKKLVFQLRCDPR